MHWEELISLLLGLALLASAAGALKQGRIHTLPLSARRAERPKRFTVMVVLQALVGGALFVKALVGLT